MAYTRPWDQVFALPGSRDSDEIDDNDREHHTDLTERLSDILYDPAADPWVLKIPGVETNGNQSFSIPAHGAQVFAGNLIRDNFDIYPAAPSTTTVVLIPIQAARDSTLVAFEIKGYRLANDASVQAALVELDATAESVSTLANATIPTSGPDLQIAASGLVNAVMTSDKSYYLRVFMTAGAAGGTTARLSSVYFTVKLPGTP